MSFSEYKAEMKTMYWTKLYTTQYIFFLITYYSNLVY